MSNQTCGGTGRIPKDVCYTHPCPGCVDCKPSEPDKRSAYEILRDLPDPEPDKSPGVDEIAVVDQILQDAWGLFGDIQEPTDKHGREYERICHNVKALAAERDEAVRLEVLIRKNRDMYLEDCKRYLSRIKQLEKGGADTP